MIIGKDAEKNELYDKRNIIRHDKDNKFERELFVKSKRVQYTEIVALCSQV